MSQYVGKIRGFTGDTGRTLDWQIGFEDASPNLGFYRPGKKTGVYYGFLGIGEGKQEDKKRAQVLKDMRAKYPAPTSCTDATAKLKAIQADLAVANGMMQSDPKATATPRYIAAFNILIPEVTDYLNKNCLSGSSTPSQSSAPPTANTDPMLQTALPGNSGSGGGGGATAANTSASSAGAAAAANTGSASTAGVGSGLMDKAQAVAAKVPAWAWWSGGGLLAVGIVIALVKKSKS